MAVLRYLLDILWVLTHTIVDRWRKLRRSLLFLNLFLQLFQLMKLSAIILMLVLICNIYFRISIKHLILEAPHISRILKCPEAGAGPLNTNLVRL